MGSLTRLKPGLASSVISKELLQSYLESRFVSAQAGMSFVLSAGRSQAENMRGHGSFAVLTACNPGSAERSERENEKANAALERELKELGASVAPMEGSDAAGEWREPGFLAYGLSLDDAARVGEKHGQNAIVWCEGADFTPRLLLLR